MHNSEEWSHTFSTRIQTEAERRRYRFFAVGVLVGMLLKRGQVVQIERVSTHRRHNRHLISRRKPYWGHSSCIPKHSVYEVHIERRHYRIVWLACNHCLLKYHCCHKVGHEFGVEWWHASPSSWMLSWHLRHTAHIIYTCQRLSRTASIHCNGWGAFRNSHETMNC